MKKIDLGQMISILANVGVIAGIVFLSYELRQNNQLLQNQARYSMMDNQRQGNMLRAIEAELMELRVKAINNEPLTKAEELRLDADALHIFSNWAWEYEQFEDGFLEDLPADGYRRMMDLYPYLFEHFENVKAIYDPAFARWMESNVTDDR